MSKKLLSTLLLFLIVAGFGIASFYFFTQAKDDGLGALYLIPAIAALVALIMLPFRQS